MHKLLSRQIRRVLGGSEESVPKDFLAAVDAAYRQADEDRVLLERAMELTSEELMERNEALGHSLALTHATLESTDEGLLVLGVDGRIRTFNARLCEIFALPAEELHGIEDLRGDPGQAPCWHVLRRRIDDTEDFERVVSSAAGDPAGEISETLALKGGQTVELYSRPVRQGGAILGRVWSFRDITEQQRLEEQFRQAQKMDAVGRLAGGIAHDFNNLLTVIIGCTDLARLRHGDSDLMPLMEQVASASRRAADLTGRLLAFSRQELLEPKILDVGPLVEEVADLMHRLMPEDLKLITRLDSAPCTLLADKTRFHQVLMNLVINARDAVGPGGSIEIQTRRLSVAPDRDSMPFGIETPGEYVVVKVKDDGHGIPPELRDRIFDPFFTTKDASHGTGLGLATVYGIVQQFHGTLDLVSESGVGTEFRLAFPFVEGDVEEEPAAVLGDLERSVNVLAVEDDPSVRLILSEMLATIEGCEVQVAASPEDALALARGPETFPLDLLISDIAMPEMDGHELAERLAELYPELKVLFASGYDPGAERPKGRAGFLAKPFDVNRLTRKIQEVLANPASYRQPVLR